MKKAGWTANRIPAGLGIINAESGGDAKARHKNTDGRGTTDRGGWQFNDYWHKEVSDSCADDPVCSSRAAWRVSKHGTDFSQWSTNGAAPIQTLAIKNGKVGSGGILGDAADAIGSVIPDIPNPLAGIDAVGDALRKFVGFFASLFEANTWFRILKVVGGVIILSVSVVALVNIVIKSFTRSTNSAKPRAGNELKRAAGKAAKKIPNPAVRAAAKVAT
jgi:hypothetical protein